MNYIIVLLLFISSLECMQKSKDLHVICHYLNEHNLKQSDTFRIPRSRSLPHVFETSQETIIEIPHNVSDATVIETIHSDHKKEKKESCCSKYKVVMWSACITTTGVICTSFMGTIVALVVHFTA